MEYDYDYKQRLPARRARVTDGGGNVGLSLQRPGFRIIDSASSNAKEAAYRAYETELVNTWRRDAVGPGDRPPDYRRQIDQSSQADAQAETIDQVYAAYDEELGKAWRKS
jgi:hypothetical protein